ncbi:DMT family transporter [Agaribacter flavus]|uniref:DMT family transporter n=1 Tax=Agaribacter flavus TaxID=1902781 RepID=A0ABV7FNJ9_9ALTE
MNKAVQGFLLASTTALMWGVLPVFLKFLLSALDAYTVTAVRFVFAFGFVSVGVVFCRDVPRLKQAKPIVWYLLVLSTLFLLLNYVTNVIALEYISPATVQLILQLAPFILLVGGVVFYKEHFSAWQMFGAVLLLVGLLLFFNQRIPVILSSSLESIEGVFIVVLSATAWALYALAQKRLLIAFTSRQLTFLIYLIGAVLLTPLSTFSSLQNLSYWQWWVLLFCCVNTIVGYGAFTRAMHIWEASKVSAIVAVAPVFTYFANKLAIVIAPDVYFDAEMDLLAYFGAGMIILGAIIASIGKRHGA